MLGGAVRLSPRGRASARAAVTWRAARRLFARAALVGPPRWLRLTRAARACRLAASVLKCGQRKVWLDPNEATAISMANSRQNIRKLNKDGLILKMPNKIHSRARVNRRNEAKRKGRHTGAPVWAAGGGGGAAAAAAASARGPLMSHPDTCRLR